MEHQISPRFIHLPVAMATWGSPPMRHLQPRLPFFGCRDAHVCIRKTREGESECPPERCCVVTLTHLNPDPLNAYPSQT